MNGIWAILLGLLQGITEFLPVSSSGHLVIAQSLIPGFVQQGVVFDTVLHAGTLLSILVYFRKRIMKLNVTDLGLIVLGTFPIIIFGLLFSDQIESMFVSVRLVGLALLGTAFFNHFIDKLKPKRKAIKNTDAVMVGLFQSLAMIPGISRSGATIFAGTNRGIDKKKSVEFSFLLSVPAVFGATLFQLAKHGFTNGTDFSYLFLGFLAAFLAGLWAIKTVLSLLSKKKFKYFAIYSLLLGLLAIFL